MLFGEKDNAFAVDLDTNAYEQMLAYCKTSYPKETGGILIGNYSNDNQLANILQITSAPKNSVRSRCSFYRGTYGLKNFLDQMWTQGQYYLGEWHYHPNASSLPSGADKTQMLTLSKNKKLNCPEPILIIIGGCKDNWNISVRVFANEKEYVLIKE